MKIRTVLLGVLFGILGIMVSIAATANAQEQETIDIRTIAHPATEAENVFIRAAIGSPKISNSGFRTQGLETNFQFRPLAGAALEVIPVPNFSAERTAYVAIAGVTMSGCLVSWVTFPSGDVAELNRLCFNQPVSLENSNYRFSVWKGELARSGTTTFQVFNVDSSGRVSVVSASTSYATNFSGERIFIGPVGLSSNGSVIVNGNFDTIAVAGNVIRNLVFISGAVMAPSSLDFGDYTMTGCLRGICATRVFHVNSNFQDGKG